MNASHWQRLEKSSASMFLIAGMLLLATAVINAIEAFPVLPAYEGLFVSVEGLTGFGGLVLSVAGLVGLYPRLASESTRTSRIGLVLVTLPAVSFLLLLVCSTLATFLGLPSPTDVLPAPGVVTGSIFLSFAIGVMLFGVIELRGPPAAPPIGVLLLLLGAVWFAQLAAIPVVGFPIPERVISVTTGLMAVTQLTIGHLLRTTAVPTHHPNPTIESTT